MFSSNGFKLIISGLAIGFVLWCGVTYGLPYGIFFAVVFLAIWAGRMYFNHNHVSLNEMEIGVVFNNKGNFVCFLDNDYGRIEPDKPRPRKLKKPLTRHTITPYRERMTAIITKGGQKSVGTLKNVRTVEGISISIDYAISFKIFAIQIKPGLEYKMARALPENASGMIGGKAQKALAHLVETKSIHELYRPIDDTAVFGSLQQLELDLRDATRNLTGIFGVDIGDRDVTLGPITLPTGFEEALEKRFQKELQTETLVAAMDQLREAIGQYEETDIKRLSELVRLRILDEQSGPLNVSESYIDFDLNTRKEVVKNGSKKANNGNN